MSRGQRTPRFLVVGLARDLESTIERSVARLFRIFEPLGEVDVFVVESDSSDRTPERLESLSRCYESFTYKSLGKLSATIQNRIERIAFCRNVYLKHELLTQQGSLVDFLVVCDFDLVTKTLKTKDIERAIRMTNVDAFFANQNGPYYDIFALRAEGWVEEDPFRTLSNLETKGIAPSQAYFSAITSKMKRIKSDSPCIFVESAFGGFAIYRSAYLPNCTYTSRVVEGFHECEHVSFNEQFKSNGGKLAIAPWLLNATYTQHTRYLRPARRLVQPLITGCRKLLGLVLSQDQLESLNQNVYKKLGL